MSTLKLLVSCATLTIQSKPLKEWRCSTRSRTHTNFFVENYKPSLCAFQWKKILSFFAKFQDKTHGREILTNQKYVYKKWKFLQGQKRCKGESLEQVGVLKVRL